jgi:hypothetical protein
MKMAWAVKRRLMPPSLSATRFRHWKWLKDDIVHAHEYTSRCRAVLAPGVDGHAPRMIFGTAFGVALRDEQPAPLCSAVESAVVGRAGEAAPRRTKRNF